MRELITLHGDADEKFPIDARELHGFLGSKQEFAHWIKAKVTNNPFFEGGQDYIVFDKSVINPANKGGRPRIDYALTVDTAKKVSMAEQTKRGEEARDYFLGCEKRLKNLTALPDFSNPVEAARAWADAKESEQLAISEKTKAIAYAGELERENHKAQPKVAFYDRVAKAPDTLSMSKAAKLMNIPGIGRNNLYKKLQDWAVVMPGRTEPYQTYVNQGWFEMEAVEVGSRVYPTPRVTHKGLQKIYARFQEETQLEIPVEEVQHA